MLQDTIPRHFEYLQKKKINMTFPFLHWELSGSLTPLLLRIEKPK